MLFAVAFWAAAASVAASQPTFNRDVLPILQNRCATCHRAGQIAPMPLESYAQARPWAKAIREAVISHKMPPWFADPHFGHFANDRSLTRAEIDTIAAWVDNGSPEGKLSDKPPARVWPSNWAIGKPDAVFEMPQPFKAPASGDIEYQYIIVPSNLKQDAWVQSVEVRPSDPAIVHHAVVYIREAGAKWLADSPRGVPFALPHQADGTPNPMSQTKSDILLVYTPGTSTDTYPPGMAKRIPAGSDFVLQFHYTAKGKPSEDRTRFGVIFAKQPPEKAILTLQMGNDRFVIPPGDPNFRVQVTGTLPQNAVLLSLFPHMHLRGKAFEYMIAGENGHIETLLRVAPYDFHWQLTYRLAQPRVLKAGTRLLFAGYFDNSPNNPLNPDPSAEVRYGEQSWEEMMIGFFDVAVPANMTKPDYFVRTR